MVEVHMAKKCVLCGKNIGMLSVRFPLLEESDDVICSECFDIMPSELNDIYQGNIRPDRTELEMLAKEIICGLRTREFNENTVEYVSTYLERKMKEIEPSADAIKDKIVKDMARMEELRKKMMFTNSYNFEGYKITKYIKLVSGEAVMGSGFLSELSAQITDFLGSQSSEFERKISLAKEAAQNKMIADAESVGANAIIAIDFDIMTFTNNIIVVSANGTAVCIEKINE